MDLPRAGRRFPRGASVALGGQLVILRRRVDALDRRIVRLLAARQRLVAAIKPFKTRLRDTRREAIILRSVVRQAGREGLDRTFVGEVYRALLRSSRSFLRRRHFIV